MHTVSIIPGMQGMIPQDAQKPRGTKVINFIGAPGAGKSTESAALFVAMKRSGMDVELVTEYAKEMVWGDTTAVLKDQLYILGKQDHRVKRLLGKVDFVITDSPAFLCLHYGKHMSNTYKDLALETFQSRNNINFYVNRTKPYVPEGRMQTESESNEIAVEIKELLKMKGIPHYDINSDTNELAILRIILTHLKNEVSECQKSTRPLTSPV